MENQQIIFLVIVRLKKYSLNSYYQLIKWASDCAKHVLYLFGEKIDDRLNNALKFYDEMHDVLGDYTFNVSLEDVSGHTEGDLAMYGYVWIFKSKKVMEVLKTKKLLANDQTGNIIRLD
ncbi:MAG: hypothetical protein ACFE95_20330 [Candidatus Hodarchaeota archaeon]